MNPVSAFSAGLLRNLHAGLRLALFRRVDPLSFSASVEQLVALVLIDLVLGLLSDLAQFGPDGYVNLWGLPAALFYLPLLLLAAYIVSRRARGRGLALLIPIAVLAAGQCIAVASIALSALMDLRLVRPSRLRVRCPPLRRTPVVVALDGGLRGAVPDTRRTTR